MLLKDLEHCQHSSIFFQKAKKLGLYQAPQAAWGWLGRATPYVPTLIETVFAWRIFINLYFIGAPDRFTPTA